MSINSRMGLVELQIKGDAIQKPSGQFEDGWIKDKDISMAIFNKDDRLFRSNTIEVAESTHIGITFTKGIEKGKNRIVKGQDTFEITSTNDDSSKSIIMLKKVVPSDEL